MLADSYLRHAMGQFLPAQDERASFRKEQVDGMALCDAESQLLAYLGLRSLVEEDHSGSGEKKSGQIERNNAQLFVKHIWSSIKSFLSYEVQSFKNSKSLLSELPVIVVLFTIIWYVCL